MFNVIEPTNHHSYTNKINTFLNFLKIYQNFELSSKERDKATFIIAENQKRGVYGGAVVFPQKIKKLDEPLCDLLSIQENRTIWCARLCFSVEHVDDSSTLEIVKLYEDFYKELYKVLGILGKKYDTNCFPMKLSAQDYRNSLLYGNWTYYTKLRSEEVSGYVYVLLALPDWHKKAQRSQQERHHEYQSADTPVSSNTDRPVR